MIDFKEQKKLIHALTKLDEAMQELMASEEAQKEDVRAASLAVLMKQAGDELAGVSIDELTKARAGIRINLLKDAGYTNLGQLTSASDGELRSISGIGEGQVSAIRDLLAKFCTHLTEKRAVPLSAEDTSEENTGLIMALARYRRGIELRAESSSMAEQFHDFTEDVLSKLQIRGRLRWFFSGRMAKEETLEGFARMTAFFRSPLFKRISSLVAAWQGIQALTQEEALQDFRRSGADFYALLESESGSMPPQELIYSSVPAQLAAQIDASELNLKHFKGHLRAYQAFGTKYILHQKRVLLGDEMGLGKTIQAIAAMAHIEAEKPGQHFLVVCPASVLINWCRELSKFSTIEPYLIHGDHLEDAFAAWQQHGGAAVTNYEMMGRIVDRIDERMRLAMLVIDEAHYIKNPDAQRSQNIRCLDNESERIVLMTGTPLENHVEEMCSLIDFIRPDMSDEARELASTTYAQTFREKLAPLYLRRLREQVLSELPPVESEIEWCSMTPQDIGAYIAAVGQRNFAAMRRVSFLQDDMLTSSKAQRILELVSQAGAEGRKIIVYSFFRETTARMAALLGSRCVGMITGSIPADARQHVIDLFTEAPEGSVIVCQIQAGGTGLNIQTASVVIFCEPQIKPSLTSQAISRVYRMGQLRNVLVYHLLCEDTVDETIMDLSIRKQELFDVFAAESAAAEAEDQLADREWIAKVIEQEKQKYLPAVVG